MAPPQILAPLLRVQGKILRQFPSAGQIIKVGGLVLGWGVGPCVKSEYKSRLFHGMERTLRLSQTASPIEQSILRATNEVTAHQ